MAWVTLAVGFTALRFSGQGMLTMVSRTMLGKWFEQRRGMTSAISGDLRLVRVRGRTARAQRVDRGDRTGAARWRGMGVAVALAMGVVAWLFYRDNPEECGLRMDGRPAPRRGRRGGTARSVRSTAAER